MCFTNHLFNFFLALGLQMTPPFGWIEMSNQAQLEWIATYLARKSISGSLPGSLVQNLNQYGSQQTINMLSEGPNNSEFRELSGKMKGAWKTRQNRKKHGNPVSLQMSKATQKQLKSLAKKRKQSQAETLSKIINDTSSEKSPLLVVRSNNSSELLPNQQSVHLYPSDMDSLLDALLDEISHRCSLKVRENGGDPMVNSDLRKNHQNMVKERVSELVSKITLLQSPEEQANGLLIERALKKGRNYGFIYY